MLDVKVGDVLASGSGSYRVVREVSRFADGELRAVSFAIKRCSWTGRPVTCVSYTDLMHRRFQPTGVRLDLKSRLDARIAEEAKCKGLPKISCCAVRDVP
jgi:hypothetical protein